MQEERRDYLTANLQKQLFIYKYKAGKKEEKKTVIVFLSFDKD